ncbi:MAG: hypothetical protein P1V13_24165 [Rhizobiaceae bacterium]|nr:hypothetical protein [Rhizobiaceae bacterium]
MNTKQQVREAVAAFSKSEDLEGAIEELLSSGFARAEISLLAGTEAVEQKLGHSFTSTRDLEDDPTVPVTAYVAKESIVEGEGAAIGGLMYLGAFIGFAPVVASGGAIGAAILRLFWAAAAGLRSAVSSRVSLARNMQIISTISWNMVDFCFGCVPVMQSMKSGLWRFCHAIAGRMFMCMVFPIMQMTFRHITIVISLPSPRTWSR